ncbi:MAG TPA: FtsX-like permease family protein [Acidimicrobiia bacterium]|nr:FtsX-like permease family protein [Acidimicrobiia bacterium]
MTSSPSEKGIGFGGLVSEAWRVVLASPVSSAILFLLTAGVCAFVLGTTGQTVQAEQSVLARIDDAGTRLITVTDSDGTAHIPASAVDRIGRVSSVDWVIGVGTVQDGVNSAVGDGGNRIPVRDLWGALPDGFVVNGRVPRPGEGLIGNEAVGEAGLEGPLGSLDVGQGQVAIVGGFVAAPGLEFLSSGVIVQPDVDDRDALLRSVHVLASSASQVGVVTQSVLSVIGAADPLALGLQTSQVLADVRIAVAGQLGSFSRNLVLVALGVSLVLVGLVVYGSVTLRRQDFGRRRALGARRSDVVALVGAQSGLVALLGVSLGVVAGSLAVWRLTGQLPDVPFTLAVGALVLLAVLVASIPPALVAAFRDPVRVLRVP